MSVQDLVKEPNYTSVVWTHFGFEPDSDGKPINEELAVCCLCNWEVHTWDLMSHLRPAHTKEYNTRRAADSRPLCNCLLVAKNTATPARGGQR